MSSGDIIHSILTSALIVVGLWMALLVFRSDIKSKVNIYLSILIILGIAFISLDYSAIFIGPGVSLHIERIAYGLAPIALFALYLFVLYFPERVRHNIAITLSILIYTIFFATLSMFSNLIISSVKIDSWGVEINGGALDLYYNLFAVLVVSAILYTCLRRYSGLTKPDKNKVKLFFLGIIIFIAAEAVSVAILPIFHLDRFSYFGDYSILIFFALTTYAIIKQHLFDIRLALVRSATYTLVLATLAGIYVVVAFVLSAVFNRSMSSPEQTISGIAISLLLAFAFQPLRRFFDRITNRVFYKDNYNTDDFFAKLNKTLSTTTDLRGLLERVAYEIGTTLKAEQAFFFIFTNPEGHYVSTGTEGHKLLPKHDAVLFEQKTQGRAAVFEASMFEDNDPVKRMMISHRIELVLPLIQDEAVIGYLCLGDHKTSGYTNRDIKALNTISDELVIAVQNALAVHEIRELNASLQQKIANATKELRSSNAVLRRLDEIKDEFIGMASHQLRTPLTSVKGYISMVIEGDAGKITPSQKQLLDQAFMSSENMVHLINDFLNVSRIQSGKFVIDKTPVDLSVLVDEEMNGLRPNATARGMKLVYKKPRAFPIVEVDEGKMRQVVMNFADNAIYYSHENSSIIVSLGVEGSEIVFTVKDTGIGVPKSEKDKLFAKFYRAANAKIQRPDGTGVGIYLAKKVIDAHGGTIIFDSVEGKGSTFGFRLPIRKTSEKEVKNV
ncbi:MAG TPA: ATP-binding protein [Candidatus Saccharimonadales bacterium]|nr:ATP-binding protein [Candidatus Saccharimonadales bacterium]